MILPFILVGTAGHFGAAAQLLGALVALALGLRR